MSNTEVTMDELAVGKKLRVRTEDGHLYTIERREDGLYFYGYRWGTETAASHEPGTPWECRGVGCVPHPFRGGPAKENVIGIGMGMQVRLDDIYARKGNHVVYIGKVVEITESAE